jgi:hypothetical protein
MLTKILSRFAPGYTDMCNYWCRSFPFPDYLTDSRWSQTSNSSGPFSPKRFYFIPSHSPLFSASDCPKHIFPHQAHSNKSKHIFTIKLFVPCFTYGQWTVWYNTAIEVICIINLWKRTNTIWENELQFLKELFDFVLAS